MRIANSVADRKCPWFMDASLTAAKLAELDVSIRSYVEDIVENGFTVIRASISKAKCRDQIAAFKSFASANRDRFEKFIDADGHFPRIVNLHSALPSLFELFSASPISYRVQKALFGSTPALYTSLFYERGSAQPAHRDTPLFSTRPEYFYLGVWVALEDANLENGALQVYRGGHKIPELNREEIASVRFTSLDEIPPISDALWIDYQTRVEEQCKAAGLKLESVCAEAGDTIIWHPQLPHGGGPIQDKKRSRFSFVMHTTPLGVPVYHQEIFFNPSRATPIDADWAYSEINGAHQVVHSGVDFGHRESFPASSFKIPSERPQKTGRRLFERFR